LLGVIFSAGKCKKKDKKNDGPVGVVGTWKINSIVNSANQTPPDLQDLVNGTAVFGDTNYEFKNASGSGVENGSYVYTANAGTLAVTPARTSVFTRTNAAYTFQAELASPNLQLRVNIAAPSKPENIITVSLTKQQ
ncbi:MAG: hypothetical protein ACK40K_09545, partial [Raineya sp.]